MIQDYLKAAYPAIWIKTWEEARCLSDLHRICEKACLGMKVWTITKGFVDWDTQKNDDAKDPLSALETVLNGEDDTLYVLINFHFFLENPEVLQLIKDCIPVAKEKKRHLVFISPNVNLPAEIEKEVTVVDYELPSFEQLEEVLNELLQNVDMDINVPDKKRLIESALGLTTAEAENAFALALVKHKNLNGEAIKTVQREKANIVKKTGVLEFRPPEFNLDDIGGLSNLKLWLSQRSRAFSDEAKKFGLPYPRGVLLVGVPGAGKSLTAKAVSASWKLPLLRFDIGQVFGSLVGQSEERMRNALKMAEVMAPCILWLDELEKGMSGLSSSGSTDSGVTARVFGDFLSWMQEKKKPVFVIATSNDVSQLPPELLRKGRFDEIFYVDLPTEEEREEIFKIHIAKRSRNPEDFDIERLVAASKGYGGAEIEEAVISGLYAAFGENRELSTDDIINALNETKPLSETMKEKVESVRKWAENRARNASIKTGIRGSKNQRQISI